jgi:aminoglycoside phosphotransferase family enzyme/predicted kinase
MPVTRQPDGHLELDGDGDPVDWVVVMNRFEQSDLFDNLAGSGDLLLKHMVPLAEHIAVFHQNARPAMSVDGSNIVAEVITQVVTALFQTPKDFVDLDQAQNFAGRIVTQLNAQSRLLRSRSHHGLVRLCHGDMHLRNIVLHDGKPALFDAIEFDDRLATIDLLYDLAFLLMDLWHRDLKGHANLCFGTYVSKAMPRDELDGLAALPLFLSVRAAIRAMVAIDKLAVSEGADREECISEIEAYLALATRFLEPVRPVLIAIGGLSGTGKTTVAAGMAPNVGRAPGALHLRSDVERKRMADVDPLQRLPTTAYTTSNSDKVYKRLCDRAERALKAGQAVVVDAVFQEAGHRRAIEQVAARARVPFFGAWLEAPQEQLIERVAGRRDDASDADVGVIQMQFTKRTAVTCWDNIDASATLRDVLLQVNSAMSARIGRG